MLRLQPLFKYFGGKYKNAKLYPSPLYPVVIEPFAGAAGYSTMYHDRQVVLVDLYPVIVGIWDYLIRSPESEILALPDIADGQKVRDLPVCQEARDLIGFWVNSGVERPMQSPSKWMREGGGGFWGSSIRERIARQQRYIRHWRVFLGSYAFIDNMRATWHVDPPYQVQGTRYVKSADAINFDHLGSWCKSRHGQVMVCENAGATWLPFRPLATIQNSRKTGSAEVIWTNEATHA